MSTGANADASRRIRPAGLRGPLEVSSAEDTRWERRIIDVSLGVACFNLRLANSPAPRQ